MTQWLVNLTQPQATLGTGIITFLGAIVAVVLGWWLFSGKVRDIKSALDATERLLTDHQSRVQQSLADVEEKLSSLTARLRTHNQNSTVAANAMAERKTFGHLS